MISGLFGSKRHFKIEKRGGKITAIVSYQKKGKEEVLDAWVKQITSRLEVNGITEYDLVIRPGVAHISSYQTLPCLKTAPILV